MAASHINQLSAALDLEAEGSEFGCPLSAHNNLVKAAGGEEVSAIPAVKPGEVQMNHRWMSVCVCVAWSVGGILFFFNNMRVEG